LLNEIFNEDDEREIYSAFLEDQMKEIIDHNKYLAKRKQEIMGIIRKEPQSFL
jgi:hypothetical protein